MRRHTLGKDGRPDIPQATISGYATSMPEANVMMFDIKAVLELYLKSTLECITLIEEFECSERV
jgi:hypothetical protein